MNKLVKNLFLALALFHTMGMSADNAPKIELSKTDLPNFLMRSANTQIKAVVNTTLNNNSQASYTLVVEFDGKIITEKTITRNKTTYDEEDVLTFSTQSLQIGYHDVKVYLKNLYNAQLQPTDNANKNKVLVKKIGLYQDSVSRQKYLVEMGTSTGCHNCPGGIKFLKHFSTHCPNIALVAIHGFRVGPDPMAKMDGGNILRALKIESYPRASFNRILSSENSLAHVTNYAEGQFAEITETFKKLFDKYNQTMPAFVTLNIKANIDREKDKNSRKLQVIVDGVGVEQAAELLKPYGLFIYLKEDNIKNDQRGSSENEHNHVFRHCLTEYSGDNISWNGNNFTITKTYNIPSEYKIENMKVVAFVAPFLNINKKGDKKEITPYLQVVNQTQETVISLTTTAINHLSTDEDNVEVVARYNVAGKRVDNQYKGIVIEKLTNGKSRTILKY